jgi:hypothetical protein
MRLPFVCTSRSSSPFLAIVVLFNAFVFVFHASLQASPSQANPSHASPSQASQARQEASPCPAGAPGPAAGSAQSDRPRPPRDAAPRGGDVSGTAVIRGRVINMKGEPIRRAQILLSNLQPRQRARSVLTDSDGRYELKNVASGRYHLAGSKPGFVSIIHGQTGPRAAGKPLDVADCQVIEKIDVVLPKGAVLAGRVFDEYGEPASDVAVTALQYRTFAGQRRLIPTGPPVQSNDIGQFRVFGLPPGEYYVRATYRPSAGGVEPDAADGSPDYAPTYYPGTASLAEAQVARVNFGEEAGVDLTLLRVRGVKVSGIAVDSFGVPMTRGYVALRQAADGGDSSHGSPVAADGSFTIHSVPPGAYVAVVMGTRSVDSAGGEIALQDQAHEVGRSTITVEGQPVAGLRLTTSRGSTLRGRVAFEGSTPSTLNSVPQVNCISTDTDFAQRPQTTVAKRDLTFELRHVYGPCMVASNFPGWIVKQVRVGGADVTDVPIELDATAPMEGIEILFTNRLPVLTGSVTREGAPIKDYTVLVFPQDQTHWTVPSRRIRTGRPDQYGQFRIPALPSGNYLAVALRDLEDGAEQDVALLKKLQALAAPARVTESATPSLTLEIAALPDR